MMVVRHVYQAKYGQADELVRLLKEFPKAVGSDYPQRLLSDASGPFFTVVQEIEAPSLAEWEAMNQRVFSAAEFRPWFAKWLALVESARREFYNLES